MLKRAMAGITIRRAKPGDEKAIAEMINLGIKRKNWQYTGTNKPCSKEKIKEMRKAYLPGSNNVVFVALDKNKIVGSTAFRFKKHGRMRHRVDCGWGVHPDYQGRGVATKLLKASLAFAKKKGFKRAEAEVAVENTASIKLAKKLGFKIEGRKKKALLTDDGRYIDTVIVGKIL